jgi:hypothetical protein
MAQSKQAVQQPSSPTIHDRLTVWIITETAPGAPSLRKKKHGRHHNLTGCCTSDTVA